MKQTHKTNNQPLEFDKDLKSDPLSTPTIDRVERESELVGFEPDQPKDETKDKQEGLYDSGAAYFVLENMFKGLSYIHWVAIVRLKIKPNARLEDLTLNDEEKTAIYEFIKNSTLKNLIYKIPDWLLFVLMIEGIFVAKIEKIK